MPQSYRHIVVLLLVMLSAFRTSWGQNMPLDSFFVPGVTWTDAWTFSGRPTSHCSLYGAHKILYRIDHDTTVAGRNYHILSIGYAGQYEISSGCGGGTGAFPQTPDFLPMGRIRTDSNKVYYTQDYYRSSYNQFLTLGREYLLYDYNVLPGEMAVADSPILNTLYVASIDSVMISNGRYIKRYNDSTGKYWVYGIGSITPNDFIYNTLEQTHSTLGEYVLCYDHPSFSYHLPQPWSILIDSVQYNCFDFSSIHIANTPPDTSNTLSVYPNPTYDYLIVELNGSATIKSITMRDATGREVYQADYPQGIPIYPGSPGGLYLITVVSSAGDVWVRKIVRE